MFIIKNNLGEYLRFYNLSLRIFSFTNIKEKAVIIKDEKIAVTLPATAA